MMAIPALPVHMAMVPHDILFDVPDEIMPSYLAESILLGDLMMSWWRSIYREHVAAHADV